MSEPIIVQTSPYPVDVSAGKKYFWCTCGRSQRQPFCDGSHEGTDFLPHTYTASETKTAYFCGCKHSKAAPLCDGSHNGLSQG
ncbi:MAG TPA: glutamate synthase [Gammaproteobacteria bacterium]|nr:MAG: CDGSH iron-sulfur domain-containing protein [OM182 bacterium]HAL41307.1 glutamate synthase [Gammaproteobacteria bacterium]HBP99196.1 glutamate synthase [Gammaproteobacteria bacterium]|tara:strand:+ start:472 stop:720 length:249 start_codon:yes stop_codon:yes gene_type:complete